MGTYYAGYAEGFGMPVKPLAMQEEWEEIHKNPVVYRIAQAVEAGNDSEKRKLPVVTFHCAEFEDGHRSVADAIRPFNRLMVDVDEKGHTDEILAKCMKLQEAKKWKILLVEDSIRRGTHIVIVLPQGMSVGEVQTRFSADIGFPVDLSVKDVARCSFVVPLEYVRYVHPDFFHPEKDVFVAPEVAAPPADVEAGLSVPASPVGTLAAADGYPMHYNGISYKRIVLMLEDQLGGQPAIGDRNNFIYKMACHLRHVCNNDADWIASILPDYGEYRPKWLSTIRSACMRKQSQRMSNVMQTTLRLCKYMTLDEDGDENPDSTPPQMPKRLPPLIKLLLRHVPKVYWEAVAHAVFPALAAHLWKTTFRYIDQVEHEATLMNVLMAPTAAGKSCISAPIRYIMADIEARDNDSREREKQWKKEVNSKGANKDKRPRPENLVVQYVEPDMTPAALAMRLAESGGRFLYTNMNELDRFDALKNSVRSKNHFQIMCLAFDPGNLWGQERVGAAAVCERVCIRYNWNAATTIDKGQKYFREVLTDGPLNRINFCTIPNRPIGSGMPKYGLYDDSFAEELKPYIDCLNQARGLIVCEKVNALSHKLVEECADIARLSQNRVYENFSFRGNVIAFLKAMVLYVAHGGKWDKTMEEFIRWSLHYDLWCKMRFFGKAIEDQEYVATEQPHFGPKNLLDMLPDIFTREEAHQLRVHQGIRTGSLKYMLANWKKRGYIEIHGEVMDNGNLSRQQYAKTAAYLKKHPSFFVNT